MTRIELVTEIRAPRDICFDLARDLDLHRRSMARSGEEAIAGRTTGLIQMGEEVTWRARHFGVTHTHTARITAFDRPNHFRDTMITGRFKQFEHEHRFDQLGDVTRMVDVLHFEAPLGLLGRLVESLVLADYLTELLTERNQLIREVAETRSDYRRSRL